MDGVEEYLSQGKFDELYKLLMKFLDGKDITTKIDGAPAVVMWSKFPGLESPGVSFKTIIKQAAKGEPKAVFTTPESIDDFSKEKAYDEALLGKRSDAFKIALKDIAPLVKPGVMLWGDVLFTPYTKKSEGSTITFTPNTLTYSVSTKSFPKAKDAKLGIFIHTAVNSDFKSESIFDATKLLSGTPSESFVLTTNDITPKLTGASKFKSVLNTLMNSMVKNVKPLFTSNVMKSLRKAFKKDLDIAKTIAEDPANSKLTQDEVSAISNVCTSFIGLKEDIIKSCKVPQISASYDGKEHGGEGYVISSDFGFLKLVSNEDFTKHNKEHMKKESELNENVEGDKLKIWSSSKNSNLFKYFIKKELEFGKAGGSNYGFATYGVLEPPFSEDAKIGYSSAIRAKLYGENIFEFEIPCKEVLFLSFEEYKKTPQGKSAKFETFIKDQLDAFDIKLPEDQLKWITPESPEEDTAKQAFRLFKVFSRSGYQRSNGTIQTKFAGFVYKGKMDGITYVGWDPYKLIPVRYSKDAGASWNDVDKNDPEYKAYIKGRSSTEDSKAEIDRIFDGKFTTKKDIAYRLLMAYNANDGTSADGKEFTMSEGIFYKITIHDDNTIDASYKFNRPITDNYVHYFRPRKNVFIDKLIKLGFKFGKLTGCGLKLGSETDKECFTIYNVPKEYLPKSVDGGLELIGTVIDKPFKCPCKTKPKLVLIKCEIQKDVFSGWKEVVLTDNEKKLNWTSTPELKADLADQYKWADSPNLLDKKPEGKKPKAKKKVAKEAEDSKEKQNFVIGLLKAIWR